MEEINGIKTAQISTQIQNEISKMKRLQLPDLLKGFAVFLIVPVHILELFIDYPGRESVFGKILLFLGGPIAVPIFMLTMGYFMAKNNKTPLKNLFRGVKVFLVGIVLNIGLNFNLLLKIKFQQWPYNPLEYIFGVDILYLAGLSIIIMGLLKYLKEGAALTAFAGSILVLIFTAFMNEKLMVTERNYILPFIGGTYSWAYFPLFPWLAYPLAGFAFYFWEEKITSFIKQQKRITGIVLFLIAVDVLYFKDFGFTSTINLSTYYHHEFWFALWSIGIVILWTLFWRKILQLLTETMLTDFFMWLGKNITLLYVIQWLIIGNIATAIYQTQPLKYYPFWFAGIFSITLLLTWLLSKTKLKIAR